jgi:hypothetical protein
VASLLLSQVLLADYSIKDGSLLILILSPRGGMLHITSGRMDYCSVVPPKQRKDWPEESNLFSVLVKYKVRTPPPSPSSSLNFLPLTLLQEPKRDQIKQIRFLHAP